MDRLPRDLQNMVCEFAYDATLSQTLAAVRHLCEIKKHFIHWCCLSRFVWNYTFDQNSAYDRGTKSRNYFLPPYTRQLERSPLFEFFVWFSEDDLWDTDRIASVMFDLDFRRAKKHLHDCPIDIRWRARESLWRWLYSDPTPAALYISKFFARVHIQGDESVLRADPPAQMDIWNHL